MGDSRDSAEVEEREGIGSRLRRVGWRSLVAGALIVLAFPPFSLAPLAIVGFAVFLPALRGATLWQGARRGYLLGLVIEGGGFYWIAHTIRAFGGFPLWLGVVLFLLWLILSALFWGFWGALCVRLRAERWGAVAAAAVLFVLESCFPRVFPWHVGSAYADWPWLAQPARWIGAEGLSVLTVVAAGLAVASVRGGRRPRVALGVLVLLWLGVSGLRLGGAGEGPKLRVGFVQPNVSFEERHSRQGHVHRRYTSELVLRSRRLEECDLLVWSEGIVPWSIRPEVLEPLALDSFDAPLIAGAGSGRRNRLTLIPPRGEGELLHYDKQFLLVFGEFVPLRDWVEAIGIELPFGDLEAGEEWKVWDVGGVPTGVSICFEGILGETGLELAERGARLHVNATEDGWFGRTSEPSQHFGLAAIRAVESGVPLVRVTNTGISGWVDRFGRIRASTAMGEVASGVYEVELPPGPVGASHFLQWTRALRWVGLAIVLLAAIVVRPGREEAEAPLTG